MTYQQGVYNDPTNKELREEAKSNPDSFIVVSEETTPTYFAHLVYSKILLPNQFGIIMESKHDEWFDNYEKGNTGHLINVAPFRKYSSLEEATKDAEKWSHRVNFTANDEFPNKSYMQTLEFELRELLGEKIPLGYVQVASVQLSPTAMRSLIKVIKDLKAQVELNEISDTEMDILAEQENSKGEEDSLAEYLDFKPPYRQEQIFEYKADELKPTVEQE